ASSYAIGAPLTLPALALLDPAHHRVVECFAWEFQRRLIDDRAHRPRQRFVVIAIFAEVTQQLVQFRPVITLKRIFGACALLICVHLLLACGVVRGGLFVGRPFVYLTAPPTCRMPRSALSRLDITSLTTGLLVLLALA